MNQTPKLKLPYNQKIAFIQAGWHSDIVGQARESFIKKMKEAGADSDDIAVFDVPGSLEIPLMAQKLAQTGEYAVIVPCGFVVDGGIYRHDFVAQAVIDGIMRVQLDTGVPVLSVVLTPQHFHEHEPHQHFFFEHFVKKGEEAAHACLQMLENMSIFSDLKQAA